MSNGSEQIPDEISDAFEAWRGGVEDGYVRYPLKHIDAFQAGAIWARREALEDAASLRAQLDECGWEYGLRADGDDEPYSDIYRSREALADEFDGSLSWQDEHLVRRRAAGPWVEVTD